MLEKYYYGKLVVCRKSGYKIVTNQLGQKEVFFVTPRLNNLGYVICKKENGECVDIKNNRRYEMYWRYDSLEKGKLYISDYEPLKKVLKKFSLKEQLQIIKTIILIETTSKLGKITKEEKEKTQKTLVKKKNEK